MNSRKSLNYDGHPTSKIEAQISTVHIAFKELKSSEQIIGLFCELSTQFIHSPTVIATTEPPNRVTRRVFRCSHVPRIAGPSLHQLSNVDIPQTDVILVRPGGRRPAGGGGSGRGRSLEARPNSTTRGGNEPHRSRGRRSDGDLCPSHRDDDNWTLNEELAVTRC
jgi:hypothetical protein